MGAGLLSVLTCVGVFSLHDDEGPLEVVRVVTCRVTDRRYARERQKNNNQVEYFLYLGRGCSLRASAGHVKVRSSMTLDECSCRNYSRSLRTIPQIHCIVSAAFIPELLVDV